MQAKQQVPAHSKILPAQIERVDWLTNTAVENKFYNVCMSWTVD